MELAKLKEPFAPSDISWRIGQAGFKNGKPWGKALAYLDNRAIMDRLDEVCGPGGWWNEFRTGPSGGVLCGITLRTDDGPVTKWDGAENTDVESVKGGLSDSMKRAAVQWGLGRYLYDLGETWIEFVDGKARYNSKIATKKDVKGQPIEWDYFNWNPPMLPDWAVPNGAQQSGPAPATPPHHSPPPKATNGTQSSFDTMRLKIREAPNGEKLDAMRNWITSDSTALAMFDEEQRVSLMGGIAERRREIHKLEDRIEARV